MKTKILMLLAALAACSSGAKDPLTLSTRVGAAGAPGAPAGLAGIVVADGIELDRARIAVRRLRVEGDEEREIAAGPLLVDVSGNALSGSLSQLVSANVPAGTYEELKLDIHRPDAAAGAQFADLVAQRASLLLDLQIDGKAFSFASALEAELEERGQIVIGGAGANVTLNIDPTTWFKAKDGSRLDPRDPAARAQIEDNIRASFKAFQDDDEDGDDDAAEHRDGGDDHGHDGADGGDDHGQQDGGGHGGEDGGGHH